MDPTLDIYESIRDAVEAIAEDEGTGFAEAYALFARSKTYEALASPKSLMWSESIPFIVDEYRAEVAGVGDAQGILLPQAHDAAPLVVVGIGQLANTSFPILKARTAERHAKALVLLLK